MCANEHVQAPTIPCAAAMASRTAACASWKPQPVPWGGRSGWPTEDPVVSGGQVGVAEGGGGRVLVAMVMKPFLRPLWAVPLWSLV